MEMRFKNKTVEVKFVSDQDVENEIVSIQDLKNRKKRNAVQGRKRQKVCKSSASEEELDNSDCKDIEKNGTTSVLFEASGVSGHQMFGFESPHSKGILTPKTPRSRKIIGTPRTSKQKALPPRTPYTLRKRLKKRIASTAQHDANGNVSDTDFSASESEYAPSDSEDLSDADESTDDEGETSRTSVVAEEPHPIPRKEGKPYNMDYMLKADDFFTGQKSVTSDHTLSRLRQPKLAKEQLHDLLGNMTLSHQDAVQSLCDHHKQFFTKWMFALREQYNVVLYGLGSKRQTLQLFREKMLKDHLVLEVNGFFPSLTMKEVVDSIKDEILESSAPSAGLLECLEVIEEELSNELFILVHNLDGPMLQSDKSQDVLSRLAKMSQVHLIASIDHINAPLVWDQAKLGRYNFVWWDVTSFQPYSGETQFESSLLVQQSGSLALSSLSNVFHSLTSNARNIFIMIVSHQLSHRKDSTYQGMIFKDLYWKAREAMLVSSDLTLRTQLTEFLDHRLVRQRRSQDGSELLQVPVDSTVLQNFLQQVKEDA